MTSPEHGTRVGSLTPVQPGMIAAAATQTGVGHSRLSACFRSPWRSRSSEPGPSRSGLIRPTLHRRVGRSTYLDPAYTHRSGPGRSLPRASRKPTRRLPQLHDPGYKPPRLLRHRAALLRPHALRGRTSLLLRTPDDRYLKLHQILLLLRDCGTSHVHLARNGEIVSCPS
jgi:hypothetical protein